jgi:Uma2 family endonuclease
MIYLLERFVHMSTVTPSPLPVTRFTPEDLLRLPDAVNYELVDGKLVERSMGYESSAIAAQILVLLGLFLRGKGLGHLAGSDASYQCFPREPSKVRKPDVSFVRTGRFPGETRPKGHSPIPPDLAIEVVSPNDLYHEVEEKVNDYLAVNVPLVWVVDPESRTVRIHRSADRTKVTFLTDSETISGEQVITGFSCVVREFFESP